MRMKELRGRTAVVTGASSGIGLQFCHRLAEAGCNLVMVSNQDKELRSEAREIARRYDISTHPLVIDLTEPDAARGVEVFLEASRIKPEILINNAGIFSFNTLVDTPEGKIETFIDLHVKAVTMLTRRFAQRFAQQGGGWILNMSSMSCWMPVPGLAMYSSTKAYIRVMSRSIHYEMRDKGVNVMVACPGGIATDLFGLPENLQRLAVRIGVLQTPERFTRNALRHLLRGKCQYINGWLNRVSILFVGMMPRRVRMLVKSRLIDKGIRRP